MDYHQSIAAPCEQTVTALSHTLNAHGYRLERSFDLHSARQAAPGDRDQYVVLLAYEQDASAPPMVISAHECAGVTHLSVATMRPGDPLAHSVVAACDEIWECLPDDYSTSKFKESVA